MITTLIISLIVLVGGIAFDTLCGENIDREGETIFHESY